MRFKPGHIVLAGFFAVAIAACSTRSSPLVPAASGNGVATADRGRPTVANVGGVYDGTVVETSQGKSVQDKLKMTLKQSGDKFTGIFDIILKTVQDEFPIIKGVVVSSGGKVILHFVIKGSPGRNAQAVAQLVGTTITGKAKVSGRHGPPVSFKYSAKKT